MKVNRNKAEIRGSGDIIMPNAISTTDSLGLAGYSEVHEGPDNKVKLVWIDMVGHMTIENAHILGQYLLDIPKEANMPEKIAYYDDQKCIVVEGSFSSEDGIETVDIVVEQEDGQEMTDTVLFSDIEWRQ